MIKIFNAIQTKQIDNGTIERQHILSIDLMERAAQALFNEFTKQVDISQKVLVFAGSGNNGGDALAVARILVDSKYFVEIYFVNSNNKMSDDCRLNKERLGQVATIHEIAEIKDIPQISVGSVIIDGLFGVGLNRPVDGLCLKVIQTINQSLVDVYSIDMPSGMFVEDNTSNNEYGIIKAKRVLTIQYPKLAMLLPLNESYYDNFKVLDIGLSAEIIDATSSDYSFIEKSDIVNRIKKRTTFSHKGTYGHALLITGSYGKMGAAILSARACLRAGVGLLTVHVPKCGVNILQSSVPEAMISIDENDESITGLSGLDVTKFTIGIGSAIGQDRETRDFLLELLETYNNPMVIDADALNLIAKDDLLKRKIPKNSILTPHPVEFDRLIGKKSKSGYLRLQYARKFAQEYHVYIILKGAYSAMISPNGIVYFNSTGNPGMSTGGSGDTLTGILTSLLAQKYTPHDAMLLGVYLHGLAADLAVVDKSEEALLPSDIINYIGKAFLYLKK